MNILSSALPPWSLVLIVIAGLVVIVIIILMIVPSLRPKKGNKTEEQIAEEEVRQIVFTPKENVSDLAKETRIEKDLKEMEKRESELGFVFTDDDIPGLLMQMEQDRIDDVAP
jgi:hypothetical protein